MSEQYLEGDWDEITELREWRGTGDARLLGLNGYYHREGGLIELSPAQALDLGRILVRWAQTGELRNPDELKDCRWCGRMVATGTEDEYACLHGDHYYHGGCYDEMVNASRDE